MLPEVGDRNDGSPHPPGHDRPRIRKHFACQMDQLGLVTPPPGSLRSPAKSASYGCGIGARRASTAAVKMAGLLPDIRSIPRQSRPPRPVGIKVAPVALLFGGSCDRPKATRAPTKALVIPRLAPRWAVAELPTKYTDNDFLLVTLHWREHERYRDFVTASQRVGRGGERRRR